ncbi:MAG: aspartate aminotransferase family protein [Anaerolineae bacterium]
MNKQEVIDNEANYVLHTYNRPEIVFTHGEGAYLYDTDGKKYLDFNAGIAVTALGHSDPEWVKAVADNAAKVAHVSNLYHTEPQATLAKKLVENSFADRVYFCNSGAESNEAAIKFARKYAWMQTQETGAKPRYKVVSFTKGFHGRTLGALATTYKEAYRKPFEPLVQEAIFAEFNNLESAKEAIDDETCAVILEPIQGEGGIHPATKEFLEGIRAICDEKDIILIFDEVQCGLGRTGYLWAHEMYGVYPDIMSLAKPLAGGLPMGATLVNQKVADAVKPGDHGSTFAAGPLVCAAANVVFDRVSDPDFLAQLRANAEHLNQKIHDTIPADKIVEVRGAGYMIGLELTDPVGDVINTCVKNGILVISAGPNTVRFIPPLIVGTEEIDMAVDAVAAALQA